MDNSQSVALDDIKGLEAFLERYPDLADESRIRWWIFHRKTNGLESSGAVIKRGGRWFVIVPRLKAWLLAGTACAA
jgi:hypothetical protein